MKNLFKIIPVFFFSVQAIAQEVTLRLIGMKEIPNRQMFKNTYLGGISGIDKSKDGYFYMISDDPSRLNESRVYKTQIIYDNIKIDTVLFQEVIYLKKPNGERFKTKSEDVGIADAESIRILPNNNSFIWTSEGMLNNGKIIQQPFIWINNLDGDFIQEIKLPINLQFSEDTNKGALGNVTLEGCSFDADSQYLWISMESPLKQDGEKVNYYENNPIRLTKINLKNNQIEKQIAFLPDTTPLKPLHRDDFSDNGISEILVLDTQKLLILERSFTENVGCSIRLYEIDLENSVDVSKIVTLKNKTDVFVKKKLLFDFKNLAPYQIDNIEGMCFGKKLTNGNSTLVFVSDDNFRESQNFQILIFEIQY